jgi:hypothetical protein
MMSFKLKEDKPCRNCGTMLHVRDCKHLTCEAGNGRCLDCDNDRKQYDYIDSPNHEAHSSDRCRLEQTVRMLLDMTRERDAWKAKTREAVREYMSKDPDLRTRELSDLNGVLEAELDLAKTRLEIAKTQFIGIVQWLRERNREQMLDCQCCAGAADALEEMLLETRPWNKPFQVGFLAATQTPEGVKVPGVKPKEKK